MPQRTCVAVALTIVLTGFVHCRTAQAQADDLQDEAARLKKLWTSQRQEISTATLEADYFYDPTARSVGQIQALVDELQGAGDEVGAVDLPARIAELFPDTRTSVNRWLDLTLTIDGPRRRVRSLWLSPDAKQLISDASYDGRNEVWYNSHSNQANVYPGRSPLRLPELALFRMVPSPDSEFTLAADPREESLLQCTAPVAMQIDRSTGFVRHVYVGYCDVWQFGAREYGRGIRFPRVVVRYWRQGRLEVLKIRSAEFNEPVAPDAFDIPLPAGITLVDLREGLEKRRATRLQKHFTSALVAADTLKGENSACQAAHELPIPYAITDCHVQGSICTQHAAGRPTASGQFKWHGATCQDPACRIVPYTPYLHPNFDLRANSSRWVCQVEFGDNGLQSRRLFEYLPNFANRVSVMICVPASGP